MSLVEKVAEAIEREAKLFPVNILDDESETYSRAALRVVAEWMRKRVQVSDHMSDAAAISYGFAWKLANELEAEGKR